MYKKSMSMVLVVALILSISASAWTAPGGKTSGNIGSLSSGITDVHSAAEKEDNAIAQLEDEETPEIPVLEGTSDVVQDSDNDTVTTAEPGLDVVDDEMERPSLADARYGVGAIQYTPQGAKVYPGPYANAKGRVTNIFAAIYMNDAAYPKLSVDLDGGGVQVSNWTDFYTDPSAYYWDSQSDDVKENVTIKRYPPARPEEGQFGYQFDDDGGLTRPVTYTVIIPADGVGGPTWVKAILDKQKPILARYPKPNSVAGYTETAEDGTTETMVDNKVPLKFQAIATTSMEPTSPFKLGEGGQQEGFLLLGHDGRLALQGSFAVTGGTDPGVPPKLTWVYDGENHIQYVPTSKPYQLTIEETAFKNPDGSDVIADDSVTYEYRTVTKETDEIGVEVVIYGEWVTEAPTDVGTYEVHVSYDPVDGNGPTGPGYSWSNPVEYSIALSQADLMHEEIFWHINYPYDLTQAQKYQVLGIIATGETEKETITDRYEYAFELIDLGSTEATLSDASPYVVSATATGTAKGRVRATLKSAYAGKNYADLLEHDFSIHFDDKIPLIGKLDGWIYGQAPNQVYDVNPIDDTTIDFVEGVDFTVQYRPRTSIDKTQWTAQIPVNAGEYEAWLVPVDALRYGNSALIPFVIAKAKLVIERSNMIAQVNDETLLDGAVLVGVLKDMDGTLVDNDLLLKGLYNLAYEVKGATPKNEDDDMGVAIGGAKEGKITALAPGVVTVIITVTPKMGAKPINYETPEVKEYTITFTAETHILKGLLTGYGYSNDDMTTLPTVRVLDAEGNPYKGANATVTLVTGGDARSYERLTFAFVVAVQPAAKKALRMAHNPLVCTLVFEKRGHTVLTLKDVPIMEGHELLAALDLHAGDLNRDGIVNDRDKNELTFYYTKYGETSDLDANGRTNSNDLDILTAPDNFGGKNATIAWATDLVKPN